MSESLEAACSVSVIIPALNEADNIARAIDRARAAGADEVVVVDGGSDDETLQRAISADHVVQTSPGRATQQNAGAQVARGDVFLFVHADSWLESDAIAALRMALRNERIVAGCFKQRIDHASGKYRIIEVGNNWRVRLLGWAYGDQAIFVRRTAFDAVAGFPDLRLMEDLFLMKRLKRAGRISLVSARVVTSACRWERHGTIRQTMRNWGLILLVHLGVSPNRLAQFYRRHSD